MVAGLREMGDAMLPPVLSCNFPWAGEGKRWGEGRGWGEEEALEEARCLL